MTTRKILISATALTIAVVLIVVIYKATHPRLPEDFPLSDRRTVTEVDHDIIQAARNFRARVDATYGKQDWDNIKEHVSRVTR